MPGQGLFPTRSLRRDAITILRGQMAERASDDLVQWQTSRRAKSIAGRRLIYRRHMNALAKWHAAIASLFAGLWVATIRIRPHTGRMAPPSKKTESYRKRAKVLNKRLEQRTSTADRAKLVKKQKALSDMADNEDWLAGKPGSQLR